MLLLRGDTEPGLVSPGLPADVAAATREPREPRSLKTGSGAWPSPSVTLRLRGRPISPLPPLPAGPPSSLPSFGVARIKSLAATRADVGCGASSCSGAAAAGVGPSSSSEEEDEVSLSSVARRRRGRRKAGESPLLSVSGRCESCRCSAARGPAGGGDTPLSRSRFSSPDGATAAAALCLAEAEEDSSSSSESTAMTRWLVVTRTPLTDMLAMPIRPPMPTTPCPNESRRAGCFVFSALLLLLKRGFSPLLSVSVSRRWDKHVSQEAKKNEKEDRHPPPLEHQPPPPGEHFYSPLQTRSGR